MKKEIKKTIYGLVVMVSIFLACGEAETMFNQILWSGSFLSIAALAARGFERNMTEEEKEERV
jgi:hypothetical protein